MDDFRKILYGTLIGFVALVVVWVSFLTISSCGYTPSCLGVAPKVDRTSIPHCSRDPACICAISGDLCPDAGGRCVYN